VATRAVVFICLLLSGSANAQLLTVLPVSIQMAPGQMAATLTVINQGDSETGIQVRLFAWSQPDGSDQLTNTDEVLASPPLTMIAPGVAQVVRLVLRRPPLGREATYRILLDQILPPAAPGTVRIALRQSIPLFAEPATRVVPHLQFHIERDAGQVYLVARNEGDRHETIREIALTTNNGSELKTEANASPYVLAGATRRWRILAQERLPALDGAVHLMAHTIASVIDRSLPVLGEP
jgi:fimbrial chaperone protein